MHLYLVRHGIAEDVGPDGTDASRRLTSEGLEKTRRVMKGLARFIEPPGLILASPKARTRQTAGIAAEIFKSELQTWDLLAEDKPRAIAKGLSSFDAPTLMIVGHEPTLGELLIQLVSNATAGRVEFKKAGCACLDIQPSGGSASGELLWLAPAKMLGMLA